MNRKYPTLGICGSSATGKSTISKILANKHGARIFGLDNYWVPSVHMPIVNGHASFERPELYDGFGMADGIVDHVSEYDDPVIAEGFLIFTYPELLELLDVRIFLSMPHEITIQRRRKRALGLGFSSNPVEFTVEHAWEAHGEQEWQKYGAPQEHLPKVKIVDGTLPLKEIVQRIEALWLKD